MNSITLPERPCLIKEIAVIRPQSSKGASYVLTNLRSGKHIRLSTEAYAIACQLNGQIPVSQIQGTAQLDDTQQHHATNPLNIISTLATHGFIANYEQDKLTQQGSQKKTIESFLMSSRHPLMDARPLLSHIGRYTNWLFTNLGVIIWACLLVFASYSLVSGPDKPQSLISWLQQLTFLDGLVLSLLIFFGKFIHEIGHALALQQMAFREGVDPGPIKIGITRFFFFPLPFTDATASWMISSQKRRAVIALAGIYFELLLAAIAVIIATYMESELIRAVLYQFAFIAGVSTLFFNLNPFIKLDGYHCLCDLLDTQNLQPRSQAEMKSFIASIAYRDQPVTQHHTGYLFYAVGSFIYRCIVLIGITIAGYLFNPALGVIVALTSVSAVLARPIISFIMASRGQNIRPLGFGLAAILLALPLIPVRDTIFTSGMVENRSLTYVIMPEGSIIEADSTGTIFSNPELSQKVDLERTRLSVARLDFQKAMANHSSIASQKREVMHDHQHQLNRLSAKIDQLNLNLATGWIYQGFSNRFFHNQHLVANEPVGVLLDREQVQVRLFLPETKLKRLSVVGKHPRFKIWRDGSTSPISLSLDPDHWEQVSNLPSASLSRQFGGTILLNPDAQSQLKPDQPYYSTTIALPTEVQNRDGFIHGERLTATISVKWTIAAIALWEKVITAFAPRFERTQ